MMLATTRRSPAAHAAPTLRSQSRLRGRSAFTLLEVLVVVAILVILATVATIATTRYIEEAKKSKAQLGCKSIETAIEAYMISNSNPGQDEPSKMPGSIENLVQVPFGGPSFLKDGESNLFDPWGKKYQFEARTRTDGTNYILVYTTAPDQTPISQYGIGPNSQPKN